MDVSAFGFAWPLDYNNLQKGQLVLAAPSAGQQYFGVVTKFRHDFVLATLSVSEGPRYGGLDLSTCPADLWLVPGVLEIEPEGRAYPVGERRVSGDGLRIDAEGHILSAFLHRNDFGQQERFMIDLMTGEHSRGASPIAAVGDVKLWIREGDRKERFLWPDLTPDR